LIGEYDKFVQWENTAIQSLGAGILGAGILGYQKHLYLCNSSSFAIETYNTNGEMIKQSGNLLEPFGMAMDEKQNLLYVAAEKQIYILDLKLELISSWNYPMAANSTYCFRGVKLDAIENTLYLTLRPLNQIFLCNPQNGTLLDTLGTEEQSLKQGEFSTPLGITVNNKFLYVCNCDNDRIEIFLKKEKKFSNQWGKKNSGQITKPRCIFNDLESLFYIGDALSVQLFQSDGNGNGICIQTLGDKVFGSKMDQFNDVYAGMCVIEDRLYVSDYGNSRIQIFRS